MSDVLEERGDLRVRLLPDDDPGEPYDDGRSPILRLHPLRWWGEWRAEYIDSIGGYAPAAINDIVTAAQKWGGDPDLFERYLRMFHATTEIQWYDGRPGGGDFVYVTFDTADWRAHHSLGDQQTGNIDMSDWRAYCEGDVYGYVIEEQATWHRLNDNTNEHGTRQTWERIDSWWGFYDRNYAEDSAIQAFNDLAPPRSPPPAECRRDQSKQEASHAVS